jgi:hypothetical protein
MQLNKCKSVEVFNTEFIQRLWHGFRDTWRSQLWPYVNWALLGINTAEKNQNSHIELQHICRMV